MIATIHVLDTKGYYNEEGKACVEVKSHEEDPLHFTLTPDIELERMPFKGLILDLRGTVLDYELQVTVIDVVEKLRDGTIDVFAIVDNVNPLYCNPKIHTKFKRV